MLDRDDPDDEYEQLFLAHLPFIRKVAARTVAHCGLRDHADDFGAWVEERLWENHYAILQKWRGESKLTTYLIIVIANFGREYRVKQWGRWRASAPAIRLGPLAVALERLVYRDGMTLAQASERLRTRGDTRQTDRELAALFARIPRRAGDVEVPLETVVEGRQTDDPLIAAERAAARRSLRDILYDALARLDPQSYLVITMHFLEGRTLADVARALDRDQRPLYRVKDRALASLRQALLDAGITADEVVDLLGSGDFDDDDGPSDGPPPDGDRDHPGDGASGPTGGNTDGPRPSNDACDVNPRDEASGSSDSAQSGRSDP